MFGSDSFIYNNDNNEPQHLWLHVLTQHPNSLHAKGIREAWNTISREASRLYAMHDEGVLDTHLLTLPPSQASFPTEGKLAERISYSTNNKCIRTSQI